MRVDVSVLSDAVTIAAMRSFLLPPEVVFSGGDGLQMRRVHAMFVATAFLDVIQS
jgi:hypothetical protein